IAEERQRSRWPGAARTRRAPTHCERSLRCSSGPIAPASVPSSRLDLARKPRARRYGYFRSGALVRRRARGDEPSDLRGRVRAARAEVRGVDAHPEPLVDEEREVDETERVDDAGRHERLGGGNRPAQTPSPGALEKLEERREGILRHERDRIGTR